MDDPFYHLELMAIILCNFRGNPATRKVVDRWMIYAEGVMRHRILTILRPSTREGYHMVKSQPQASKATLPKFNTAWESQSAVATSLTPLMARTALRTFPMMLIKLNKDGKQELGAAVDSTYELLSLELLDLSLRSS